jgi:hypothetical protein
MDGSSYGRSITRSHSRWRMEESRFARMSSHPEREFGSSRVPLCCSPEVYFTAKGLVRVAIHDAFAYNRDLRHALELLQNLSIRIFLKLTF